jgi:hypothetical protein
MEWESRDYGKLLKEYDSKNAVLNHKRIESDGLRHDLYRKRDSGTKLTQAQDNEIDKRCNYEDNLIEDMNDLKKLLENVYEAMDKLKEELDKHSDSI